MSQQVGIIFTSTLRRLPKQFPQLAGIVRVVAGGQDVTVSGLDVGGAATVRGVQVLVDERYVGVEGVVNDSKGQPVPFPVVLFFSEDQASWVDPLSRFVRSTRGDSEGRFEGRFIVDGPARAVALRALDETRMTSKAFLLSLFHLSTRVEVRRGVPLRLVLRLGE